MKSLPFRSLLLAYLSYIIEGVKLRVVPTGEKLAERKEEKYE